MLVYSTVHDRNSDYSLITYLRQNKYLWDYKFYFDQLTKKQTAVLIKSLIKNKEKTIFVCVEGRQHSYKYWRPYRMAKSVFTFVNLPNAFYYNEFFAQEMKILSNKYDYSNKNGSKLIEKVCFISSNYGKMTKLQNEEPQTFAELDIFGEFNRRIIGVPNPDRSGDSLATCAKYMASLCIENNQEEGYFQGSALWALYARTPPILSASPTWKNFLRDDFVIDFMDYKEMNTKQRLKAINKVQERLYSGDTWLTNLTLEYIDFFKEAFSPDAKPNFNSIIEESKKFRQHFITP